jgi:hypothetical protein
MSIRTTPEQRRRFWTLHLGGQTYPDIADREQVSVWGASVTGAVV